MRLQRERKFNNVLLGQFILLSTQKLSYETYQEKQFTQPSRRNTLQYIHIMSYTPHSPTIQINTPIHTNLLFRNDNNSILTRPNNRCILCRTRSNRTSQFSIFQNGNL